MQIVITPSDKPTKKFEARIYGRKYIHFGSRVMSAFTIHQDNLRKQRYIDRHSKSEDCNNALTDGFYSRWLLWNKNTLKDSIDDVNRRFPQLHITYKG